MQFIGLERPVNTKCSSLCEWEAGEQNVFGMLLLARTEKSYLSRRNVKFYIGKNEIQPNE